MRRFREASFSECCCLAFFKQGAQNQKTISGYNCLLIALRPDFLRFRDFLVHKIRHFNGAAINKILRTSSDHPRGSSLKSTNDFQMGHYP